MMVPLVADLLLGIDVAFFSLKVEPMQENIETDLFSVMPIQVCEKGMIYFKQLLYRCQPENISLHSQTKFLYSCH